MDLAMPYIILNFGGEMLYILEQRLRAQNIAKDKGVRVLQDVVTAMFSPSFVDELFVPQPLYTMQAIRLVFDRLAHSSIMRLNQSSMEKLFDLMTMGVKYQTLQCRHPEELLHVTLNHLDTVRDLLSDPPILALVDACKARVLQTYRPLTWAQFHVVRQHILEFLQGRRVKVSLFLQKHLQGNDGAIYMKHTGRLPRGAEVPGTLRSLRPNHSARVTTGNAQQCTPPVTAFDLLNCDDRPCRLGLNMYADTAQAATTMQDEAPARDDAQWHEPPQDHMPATRALNALADLLGRGSDRVDDKFTIIDLFPDTSLTHDEPDLAGAPGRTLTFHASTDRYAQGLADRLGDVRVDDDDDDLLALMDATDEI